MQKNADINNETREICIQGGINAYGHEDIFKVSSVVLVTPMLDNRSKRREKETPKRKQTVFADILKEAREDLEEGREVTCSTAGYTRDAKIYSYMVQKHEYV